MSSIEKDNATEDNPSGTLIELKFSAQFSSELSSDKIARTSQLISGIVFDFKMWTIMGEQLSIFS